MEATQTRPLAKTVSVRISRRLADAIAKACRKDRLDPSEKYGPAINEWAAGLLRGAIRKAADPANIVERANSEACREARVRLPRGAIAQLGVVGSIDGRTVSDMVEEKMWELLGTK